ncbi:Protein Skeletor, isoforms B/C [Halotydeus destructor]|nr:Protein Skeletor, isoforms B/C [Halotydeus destructor]
MSGILRLLLLVAFVANAFTEELYFGKKLGRFPETSSHDVKGFIYAPDDSHIYVDGFNYDGAGPAAVFWAGTSGKPSQEGFTIPDELGRTVKLGRYRNKSVLLTLPDGKKVSDIKWISVWCRDFAANFGHIDIPDGFVAPQEHNLGRIPTLAHGTSADSVIIKDIRTIQINNLRYDGAGPDAFFLVGKGEKVDHQNAIKLPDEKGSMTKLKAYRGQDITLRLPHNITVFDIDWFALYCIRFRENFGNVYFPAAPLLNVPADLTALATNVDGFKNCETIFPEMQVSWDVRKPDIYIQLEGRIEPNRYMSFGMSGDPEKPSMIGADVTVVYYDSEAQTAKAVDYVLTDYSQCAPQSQSGACPDTIISQGKNNVELMSWNYYDGILRVAYRRPLMTGDDAADQELFVDSPVTIVAAIGPLNGKKETAKHTVVTRGAPTRFIFDRPLTQRNCKPFTQGDSSASAEASNGPWIQPEIRNETKLNFLIGPSGQSRGYDYFTGINGWGITYWVNDKILPLIFVERGKTYTFTVEAGNDPRLQAKYHPLYLTNNKVGGIGQKAAQFDTPDHMVYAGVVKREGQLDPGPGAGRYCELKHKDGDMYLNVSSWQEYRRTLHKDCEGQGSPAQFTWTPNEKTPDVVYYQCFTHENLGWKIIVQNGSPLTKPSLAVIFVTLFAKFMFRN